MVVAAASLLVEEESANPEGTVRGGGLGELVRTVASGAPCRWPRQRRGAPVQGGGVHAGRSRARHLHVADRRVRGCEGPSYECRAHVHVHVPDGEHSGGAGVGSPAFVVAQLGAMRGGVSADDCQAAPAALSA